ncbi:MAG: tetratricopeptide repeat protein [Verrucomicrobiota bacterium]|nr:tetratricopeptide repeat protein [Verrucomicrobiota bacterium]
MALLFFFPRQAGAQASVNELRQSATMKLARGAFDGAIPDLQKLVELIGDSKDPRIRASMEMVFYELGIARFFVGEFEKSEAAFRDYVKRYPAGQKIRSANVYIADSLRFKGKLRQALDVYTAALKKHEYDNEWKADIYCGIARCHLADGNWRAAVEPLRQVIELATDYFTHNWACTLLTTSHLKDLDLDKIYLLVPFLLRPHSFAAHSVAFNMAAMEAGDALFQEEKYRDALWVHRLVFPRDLVQARSEQYLDLLRRRADRMRETPGDPRGLMRLQESIGELEEEIKALGQIENYDIELHFRISRGYMEMFRFWEGRELFLYLHETCTGEKSEEALYMAFRCSSNLQPWDRAYQIGEKYMEKYPAGEWFDLVTLAMGQMYAKQQNWLQVMKHLTRVLEIKPKHQSAAECMFLIGYAAFMEEMFAKATVTFKQLIEIFPENELAEPTVYWLGMSLLFGGQYAEAAPQFDRLTRQWPNSMYVEDSAFRRAVCDYGLSLFEESGARLKTFGEKYPKSKLASESVMMLGDIAGATGQPKEAVKLYQGAMFDYDDLNIEYYNHCAFQAGRVLADEEDWVGIRSHFQRYLDKNKEGSNLPQALYWIGKALWNTGEHEGALRFYREGVEKYGKDPKAIGTDFILEEWIALAKRGDAGLQQKAWIDMRRALRDAKARNETTTILRLTWALQYDPETKHGERHELISSLLKDENLQAAGPGVLQTMLDSAMDRKQPEFAEKVANHMIANFTETDYALDARMFLATRAIEQAKATKEMTAAEKLYEEAIKHLGVIRTVFAMTDQAALALNLLGKLHMQQKKYKEADEAFKSVLGVKEWRALWPEALYGRGEVAFEQRKFAEATAYYERIYLMYSNYKEWSAKAYLRRAESLKKLFQYEKATEVIEEMLKDSDLAKLPEAASARTLLSTLKR